MSSNNRSRWADDDEDTSLENQRKKEKEERKRLKAEKRARKEARRKRRAERAAKDEADPGSDGEEHDPSRAVEGAAKSKLTRDPSDDPPSAKKPKRTKHA